MKFTEHIIKEEYSWSIKISNRILNLLKRINDMSISDELFEIVFTIRNGKVLLWVRLFSNDNLHCPIFINLDENIVDIQLKNGAEYLYLFPIETEVQLERLTETLEVLLTNPINERIYLINEKVVGTSYTTFYKKGSLLKKYKFGSGKIWFPFWKRPGLKSTTYKPWID